MAGLEQLYRPWDSVLCVGTRRRADSARAYIWLGQRGDIIVGNWEGLWQAGNSISHEIHWLLNYPSGGFWELTWAFISVAHSCPALCDPMNCSMPGFSGFPVGPSPTPRACSDSCPSSQVMPSNHPLLPLLLLPSIFPSIMVFANDSVLHIRWPKFWSHINMGRDSFHLCALSKWSNS